MVRKTRRNKAQFCSRTWFCAILLNFCSLFSRRFDLESRGICYADGKSLFCHILLTAGTGKLKCSNDTFVWKSFGCEGFSSYCNDIVYTSYVR